MNGKVREEGKEVCERKKARKKKQRKEEKRGKERERKGRSDAFSFRVELSRAA